MNPRLSLLQPYPFQKLRQVLAGTTPPPDKTPVDVSIGEPKHPVPELVGRALTSALPGLAQYPPTAGNPALRETIAAWIARRHGATLDPATAILPCNGSREALFAIAQAVLDPQHKPLVVCPNPFYQIYEGAALLAGGQPLFLNTLAGDGYRMNFDFVPAATWEQVGMVFVCSPGNPTGAIFSLEQWKALFDLSDRHGFVIVSDECYSEIWYDEPPPGALDALRLLGRGLDRLVVVNSLSKRSNVPGMRSGFVCGDPAIMADFLLYRTYHGSAMSPAVQAASVAAWSDEAHVEENRALYRAKLAAVLDTLGGALNAGAPEAAFYLWLEVPGDDVAFARRLYAEEHVTVLPGSFLAREAEGVNPGHGRIRLALTPTLETCVEGARRLASFAGRA